MKRLDYITWDEYFMGVALLAAMRSKDPNTQVGACIVDKNHVILSTGYNGFPKGCSDDVFPWERTGEDTKYTYVVHAELNAILNSGGKDLRDSVLYVSLFPCNECAKAIIQSGISEVVYLSDKYETEPSTLASKRMLQAAGVLLAAAAVLPACIGAWQAGRSSKPTVTDSKYQAMTYIRENLPEDTSVAGWWDDGYFTEYALGRRTLADGGSSSGRMNWLLAKALLTDDPELSARILRMLDGSGTDVLDDMTEQGLDEADAADLLLKMLSCERSAAKNIAQDANMDMRLLDKIHPNDRNGVVLTLSTDLIGKVKPLNYYAFWNPSTGRAEQSARMLASSESVIMDENHGADLAMCQSDIVLRIWKEHEGRVSALYLNSHGEQYNVGRICVWQNGIKIQDDLTDPDPSLAGIVLVKEGDRYCGVICNQNICDSILLRTLLCEDRNLDRYRLLGTWYGDTGKESSQAQNRINYLTRTAWAVQVWQLE